MGKTNSTYRDRVTHARENIWDSYRRALRHDAQQRFDHLWDEAAQHSMAGGAFNPGSDVERTVFMSMFLAQQREIDQLRERVAELDSE